MKDRHVKYKIKEVIPFVFHVTFKNQFDMTMTFLRKQEFYESTKYQNKQFTIVEYMRWYSRSYGEGTFSYNSDFIGFNFPDSILNDTTPILDKNVYDSIMSRIKIQIHNKIKNKKKNPLKTKFYVIASLKKDKTATNHEIAHSLFYLDKEYRDQIEKLIDEELSGKVKKKLFKILKDYQYRKSVYLDEIQAYFSTGLSPPMKKLKIRSSTIKKFKKLYRKSFKKAKMISVDSVVDIAPNL